MSNGDINSIIAEATEKLRREAYAAGWRDALAAINRAAGELAEPTTVPEGLGSDFTSPTSATSGGPKQGSTPWYVLQAVKKKPGMAGSEIVDAVQEGGHRVSDGSIRTSLMRLGEKKLIVSRHRKWFPA